MISKRKKDFESDIPVEIRKMVLHAHSFYPEIRHIKIEFVINENIRKSVLQAQPKFITMSVSRKKRTYLIKISKSFDFKEKSIPIHELPEEVLNRLDRS